MVLPRSFFVRSDVVSVARELLGTVLVCGQGKQRTTAKIVETEAYKAPEDRGSHAFGNRLTPRTATLFCEGGVAYVYLCYGIHHLFNVVSGVQGEAHAVLIRAVEPLEGVELMKRRRPPAARARDLTNGPGKFTKAMAITTADNGISLLSQQGKIRIERGESPVAIEQITAGPRVGIAYAGTCANRPWRFRIKNNAWTSRPDEVTYRIPDFNTT